MRIIEHEGQLDHNQCVDAYIAAETNNDIEVGINKMENIRRQQVLSNRKVVDTIVDVIKYLAKQGLAFRGSENESASDIDTSFSKGNFMELIKLMSKYSPELKNHLNKCKTASLKSRKRARLNKSPKNVRRGRGSLVSFLSKTTVAKIVKIMKNMLINKIVIKKLKTMVANLVLNVIRHKILRVKIKLQLFYVILQVSAN